MNVDHINYIMPTYCYILEDTSKFLHPKEFQTFLAEINWLGIYMCKGNECCIKIFLM